MPLAQALSGDARLLPVPDREDLTVLTVGASAANLLDSAGRLWSLGGRHLPDAPGMWRLDLDGVGALRLEPGAVVPLTGGRLRCHGLTVDLRGARPWRPARGPRISDPAAAHRAVTQVAGELRPGVVRRVAGEPPARSTALVEAVADRLRESADAVVAAVRAGDPAAVTGAARGLVGLGPGLTPSGDDWLAGLAVALHHLGPARPGPGGPRPAAVVGAVRAAVAPGATTLVSAHMLDHALQGRGAAPLHDLLAALAETDLDPATVGAAVDALLAIGHTSGADQLCGVLVALELFPTEGVSCPPEVT